MKTKTNKNLSKYNRLRCFAGLCLLISCSNAQFYSVPDDKSSQVGALEGSLAKDENINTGQSGEDTQKGFVNIESSEVKNPLLDPSWFPSKQQIAEVVQKCVSNQDKIQTTKQTLNYKQPTSSCQFGKGDNLPPKQASITAVEANSGTVALPLGTICDVEIKSVPPPGMAQATLRYDDFLILTLDDEILFFSNATWMGLFEQRSGVYRWDFAKIKGQNIGNRFEASPYCLAGRESCQFPGHDRTGSVNLRFTTNELAPIAAKFAGRSTAPMTLNVTGDDNPTDCIHTPLTVEITLRYLPL